MTAQRVQTVLVGVIAVLIAALLVATGFLARVLVEPDDGAASAASPAATQEPAVADASAGFGILNEIYQVLEEDYVEPDDVEAGYLREGAINGLFEALGDPHSTYIDPQTYAISRDDFSGTFQGIGATVAQQDNHVVIVTPLPGTPAEEAGIRAGDVILAVNGEDATGWSVQQAVIKIRGPEGTEVELTVRHADGSEETLTIVRDEIEVSSVRTQPPLGPLQDADGEPVDDVAYVQVTSITRLTPQEVRDAVEAAEEAGARGLIIDVRANPGGLLQETVELTDMFLDEGEIVVQVDRAGNESVASATPGQITDLPIVIVQDEFSASGAELFAAALKEHGRATVVGTRSFGKGTVNHVRELSNGGAVYVSIARWLTPDRNQIEGQGVAPDVPVEVTIEDIEAGRDVALIRAVEVLRSEGGIVGSAATAAAATVTATP